MTSSILPMTNRELYTRFMCADPKHRYEYAEEMAKRLNMRREFSLMPTEKTIQRLADEFRHWKLNGAGDCRC